MLPCWSTLGIWIPFVSPVPRTSCHSYSGFQCSWAVALATCRSWFWTLSSAAASALWNSEIQKTTEMHMDSSGFLCIIRTPSSSVRSLHICKHTFGFSGLSQFTHMHVQWVFFIFCWRQPLVAQENPGHYLYLLVHFFQKSVGPELRLLVSVDPTQLLLSLKEC